MQHVYKEAFLYFHGPSVSNSELIAVSKSFQYPPVIVVPTSWYQATSVTWDLWGHMPISNPVAALDKRTPEYNSDHYPQGETHWQYDTLYISGQSYPSNYNFNWAYFYGWTRALRMTGIRILPRWMSSISEYIPAVRRWNKDCICCSVVASCASIKSGSRTICNMR